MKLLFVCIFLFGIHFAHSQSTCPSSAFSSNSIDLTVFAPVELEITPQSGGPKRSAIAWKRRTDDKIFLPLMNRAAPGQAYSPLPSALYNVPNVASCGGDGHSGNLRPKVIFFRAVLMSPIISGTVVSLERLNFDLAEDCTAAAGTSGWCGNPNTGFGAGGACNGGGGPAGYVSIDLRGTGFTLASAGNSFTSAEASGSCGHAVVGGGLVSPVMTAETATIVSYLRAKLDVYNDTAFIYRCSSGMVGPRIILSRRSDNLGYQVDSNSTGTIVDCACPANTYSFGSSACSSCPSGSAFISSSLGCQPLSTLNAGPIDTSFYLSGSQTEGVSAFTNIINSNGLTYYSSATSFPNAALVVASGSYLSSPLLSSLPTGSSPFTVSSWVKCDTSLLTDLKPSSVIASWGESQLSTSMSLNAATLAVSYAGLLPSPIVTVTTIAGSGTLGYIDDIGTNAQFKTPGSIVVDVHGTIFVGEFGQSVIRKISPLGVVSTLAGKSGTTAFADGVGTNAKFNNPSGITIDASGTIFVADYHNCRIRKITQQGNVETLAGEGTAGYADGPGNVAMFKYPVGVIVDSFGTVFVGDKDNIQLIDFSNWDSVRCGLDSGENEDTIYIVPEGVGKNLNMTCLAILFLFSYSLLV